MFELKRVCGRTGVLRCRGCASARSGGNLRRFVATRYRGRLSPDDGAPLTAMFDTGASRSSADLALLVIRGYLR